MVQRHAVQTGGAHDTNISNSGKSIGSGFF
jgi:hypothetical protein